MSRRSSSVTIRDVARKAGVSVATVSRYINRNATVSPEVSERLGQVLTEMKYVPHAAARNLASRKTRVIGLLLNNLHNDFFYIPAPGSGGKTVPEPGKPWSLSYRTLKFQNSDVDERGQIKPGAPGEQLYNLDADLSQRTNVAASQPKRLKAMRERFLILTAGFKPNGKSED